MLATWSGDIPNGTVWSSAEVQQLTGNVRVPAGSTLTIQPGTIIKANTFPAIRLTVEGTLNAQGTQALPIVFTSVRDDTGLDGIPGNADDQDTNGDGPSTGAAGDWGGINIAATATGCSLDHIDFRYGSSSQEPFGTPAILINGGQVTFANSTIRKSLRDAVRVAAGTPVLNNVSFVDNNNGGAISMALAANPAITGGAYTNNAVNGLLVDAGTLTGDAAWDDPSVPYVLTGDVTVPAGKTLTIGAGQIVKSATIAGSIFTSNILVDGKLLAQGTAQQPVIFTSRRDDTAGGDTNNDGATAPSPGDWATIRFSATSAGSVMDHVDVRYGGNSFFSTAPVLVNGGGLTLSNSIVSNSQTFGVRVAVGAPLIQNATFTSNLDAAISMALDTNPAISGCTFTGNAVNGVKVDSGSLTADATWDDSGVVYQMSGDITIPSGKTLTIAPGQIVKSATLTGFIFSSVFVVNGKLVADGTLDRPIIFTSKRDDTAGGDTNNDGASVGAKGDWGGIFFAATSTGGLLDHVEVRFGGHLGMDADVHMDGGAVAISNSLLRDSRDAGLRVSAGRPKLTNVAIEDNGDVAVSMAPAGDVETHGVTARGNSVNAIVVDGGTLSADSAWTSADLVYQPHAFFGDLTIAAGVTLTIGANAVLDMPPSRGLLGAGSVINNGVIRKSTNPAAAAAIVPSVTNTGTIKVLAGSLNLNGGVTNNGNGTISGQVTTTLGIGKNLVGNTTNAATFAPLASVLFQGSGTQADPQLLEALSADKGNVAAGFDDNFTFYSMTLANNTRVKLIDAANNAPGAAAEAIYVNNLVIPSGTTLDLNGFNVYARATQLNGTITGGTVTVIPDGGPLSIDSLTPGKISANAEIDDWTFFGRAGQAVTITLGTGSGSPTPPIASALNRGQVTLLSPDNATLGTASNSASGQEISLTGTILPADGVYHVKVQAAPAIPNSTGNYVLAVWNATVNVAPLVLNETIHGDIDTPFRTDRWTFSGQLGQVFDFQVLNAENANVQFDLTGPNGFTAFSNQSSSVGGVTLPTAGDYAVTVHTAQRQLGAYAFRLNSVTVTNLTLGTPFNGPIVGGRQSQLFKVNVPTSRQLRVALTDTSASDRNEIYLKFGSAPTRADFQYKFTTPASANQQVDVPAAAPGDWFILLYSESAPAPGNITLLAEGSSVFLTRVTPDHAGNSAEMVLTLTGVGFDSTATVSMVAPNNTVIPPTSTQIDLPTQITAKFAAALPPGTYALRVNKTDGGVATLANAFTITQGGQANLEANVILPAALGYHTPGVIYVEYANTGEIAMPAPLFVLTPTQTYADGSSRAGAFLTLDQTKQAVGFWTSAEPYGFSHSLQLLGSGATPGILQPGERVRVPVYWAGWQLPFDFTYPPFVMDLGVLRAESTSTVDWASLKTSLQPDSISTAAWDGIYPNLIAQLGASWGEVVRRLDQDAAYLGSLGERVTDVGQLWSFEIQQANGMRNTTLATAVDMSLPAVGLSLGLGRTFGSTITDRNVTGPFGNGWVLNLWSQTLSVLSDGTVVIKSPSGSQRVFQPDSRSGAYFANTGDHGQLRSAGGGAFELTDPDGTITQFTGGHVGFILDTNGNKITAAYTGDKLTSLTASSGQSLTLAYNAAGHISGLTNSLGQTATYTYDATNQFLLSATDMDGYVTSYTYDTSADPAKKNTLLTITFPDNTLEVFSYDAKGRLNQTSQQAGAQAITYAYGVGGTVTATNILGDTTTVFLDHRGLAPKTIDPLGRSIVNSYDGTGNTVMQTGPTGQIYTYQYDKRGNRVESRNPLGQVNRFTYGPLARLTSLTDAKGNTTRYQYDAQGNLLSTIYPDSTIESLAYDPAGQLLQSTDGNKNVIQYAYNTAGQLTKKKYADNSETVYAYDALANLASVKDSTGTTALEYDAANRLKKVTYPDNKFFSYSYNPAGRRTQMVDQTGFTVNYTYDSLGQLSGLKDGVNAAIVTYTYDVAGRLKEELKGNGTKTTYTYDAAGAILSIINAAPGGGVNSSFLYTYDKLGLATSETTLQGKWEYTYDAIGQLTHAVFTSNNPAQVANQDLKYFYDGAGNRTQTIINGVTTTYVSNSRNEYTQVGSTVNTYDANGNLTSRTDTTGTTTFAYNADSRLVGIQSPTDGPSNFQYDAFGSLYTETHGGVQTRALFDPLARQMIGQFTAAGNVLAHYTYGAGLVSQVSAAGVSAFYDFDLRGSTAGVTDAAGVYVNSYRYSPFGEMLAATEGLSNGFEYVGRFGVMSQAANLQLTDSRFYDSGIGQFAADDRLGLQGGDVNLRRYVGNNPVTRIDPSGGSLLELIRALDFFRKAHDDLIAQSKTSDKDDPEKRQRDVYEKAADSLLYVFYVIGSLIVQALKRSDPNFDIADLKSVLGPAPSPASNLPAAAPTVLYPPRTAEWPPLIDVPRTKLETVATQNATGTDPNEKLGPIGFGANGFIAGDGLFPYRVNFENDKDASAPAQQVRITDQLSASLSWDTFEFTEFGFGDEIIAVPTGSQSFQTTVPMTFNKLTFDVLITGDFFSQSGMLLVLFQSIDPNTELPPEVLTGFLPPEDGTGRGQGHFSYVVQPKKNLATGAQIKNIALITFDSNPPIATNQVDPHDPSQGTSIALEALNTIDVGAPTSKVAALPVLHNAVFTLQWSGADDAGGSGVRTYDVFVSDNNGPYTLFRDDTTATSATFTGQGGHTYRFYSVATDNVGQAEAIPPTFDAQTVTTTHPWFNAPRPLDADNNGQLAPLDALVIINYLNAKLPTSIPPTAITGGGPGFLDTNANDEVAPLDALLVINGLNAGLGGEGEAVPATSAATISGVEESADLASLIALLASDLADLTPNKRRKN